MAWIASQNLTEFILRFIVISLLFLMAGCETTKLWSGDPEEDFVKIAPTISNQDVEALLKQSGREYYCQNLYASTYPNDKVCYAKLTTEDKIKRIHIKLLKTPETLIGDAGQTIKIVGYVALDIIMHSGYRKG
jgi:hypothetical protein